MPQVIVSTTTTLDGYLDDTSDRRLILSSEEDTYEIHRLRAQVGAILIGAETLRRDNPRLNIRYGEIHPDQPPAKIVVTSSGDLDSTSRFFSEGSGIKIVFCGPNTPSENLTRLAAVATVVPCNQKITATAILAYLTSLGIARLLVEGGAIIQEMFLAERCVDILRLGHAPLLLGKHGMARFLSSGAISPSTLTTLSIQKLGSTAVTWYQVKSDSELLKRAATLGNAFPKKNSTRSEGTIILNKYGEEITGTSEELPTIYHATEVALIKAQQLNVDTEGATVFATVEPCIERYTMLNVCCPLLVKSGIARVVLPNQIVHAESRDRSLSQLKKTGIAVEYCDI
jgi:5-amino-6-(5-phosphoribosylamino)uracil reductase